MGAELAFTQIKASFVAFSSIMAHCNCSLIIYLSSSVITNNFCVSSTSCKTASSLACIVLLSTFCAVISHFGFTTSCPVASSNCRGVTSSFMSLQGCGPNKLHQACFATRVCMVSSSCFSKLTSSLAAASCCGSAC